jgi:6-phosphogluconate dehydrogenase
MTRCDFGLIGMAVMGQNLALNIERNGFSMAVYNRTAERTKEFMAEQATGKKIKAAYSLEELVDMLEKPRKIMTMVKAGAPVDAVIDQLKPHLEPGDLIIDGGNSFFGDTERRAKDLEEMGLLYIGTGVSGGEYGALWGPSIMPGGQPEAYALVEAIFTAIAARVNGDPCVTYIGPRGAGHYVKMVHNGIEYGDMQLIAESYDILYRVGGLSARELHEVFAEWNQGELESYLIEITADIFARMDDETGKPLVDVILDEAKQKGTGKWTSQNALDLGAPTPTINAAVESRIICAKFLNRIREAYERNPDLPNLLLDPGFKADVESGQEALRFVIKTAVGNGVPCLAFSSALAYFDAYRTARLPANLTQAQRDYFGAHTYRRVDKEGVFHTEWQQF